MTDLLRKKDFPLGISDLDEGQASQESESPYLVFFESSKREDNPFDMDGYRYRAHNRFGTPMAINRNRDS